MSTFIEQITNDPDSFGTKLKLKETFDSIMREAKQRLPPTHPERIKVIMIDSIKSVLLCLYICVDFSFFGICSAYLFNNAHVHLIN